MKMQVRGVRSVAIEMGDPARAAEFFIAVWNLTEVARADGAYYLRGTGRYHHLLAIHPAADGAALRSITFDAADRDMVARLHGAVRASGCEAETPYALGTPGGGFGFGFVDPEGRNLAVVCGLADHAEHADIADRPRKIAHVNVNARDVAVSNRFLIEALGFRLIDETAGGLSFFHCDNPDHSSYVVCKYDKPTLNHIAFELPDLDSVMRGAGRMRDRGFPIEWGVGRHGAGNNVFAYFCGPEELPIEYTGGVQQIDDSYVPHGPDHWRFPPGRVDQWGVTNPHTPRWKRVQDVYRFVPGGHRV
jgi:catechol 2,3-dioxygenase-like lactoylglutathione lyase family enzyme